MAKVSISTASRALSNDRTHPVAARTQERILEAVHALQYQPNAAAQQLVRGNNGATPPTYNVGLILGNVSYKFSDPFWAPVLNGVDDELTRQEYHLRFAFLIDDLKRRQHRRLLNRTHIDGLIMVGLRPFGDALGPERTVVIEGGNDRVRWDERLRVDVISIEKRRAMYRLVDHLVALSRSPEIWHGLLSVIRA